MGSFVSPLIVGSTLILAVVLGTLTRADETASDAIVGPCHATVSLPSAGAAARGFRCEITVAEVNAVGCVPVRIAVRSIGKFASDRHFVVRFDGVPADQFPPANGLSLRVPVRAQQGTSIETVTRYLPKWSVGQSIEISVLEDDRPLNGYQTTIGAPLRHGL